MFLFYKQWFIIDEAVIFSFLRFLHVTTNLLQTRTVNHEFMNKNRKSV